MQETHFYKIGVSKNPKKRIRDIACGLPVSTKTICIIKARDMFTLEGRLHKRFIDKKTNGEWFTLSEEDVDYIKGLANE